MYTIDDFVQVWKCSQYVSLFLSLYMLSLCWSFKFCQDYFHPRQFFVFVLVALTSCSLCQNWNMAVKPLCLAHWFSPRRRSVRHLLIPHEMAQSPLCVYPPHLWYHHCTYIQRQCTHTAFVPISYTLFQYTPLPYLSTWSSASHGASSYRATCMRKLREKVPSLFSGWKSLSSCEDGCGCSSTSSGKLWDVLRAMWSVQKSLAMPLLQTQAHSSTAGRTGGDVEVDKLSVLGDLDTDCIVG